MRELGWVRIHRAFINWEWFHDRNMVQVFLLCLLKANYTGKSWQGMDIKRGSFITSYGKLASETGLSVQEIRTCFSKLKKTGEISTASTNKNTLVTIVKYDDYQESKDEDQQANNKPSTDEQQTNNKPSTTTKKVNKEKKGKKEKEYIPEFPEFLKYAKEKKPEVDSKALKLKYDAWIMNNWKDGNNKTISNWKLKLTNTLSFIPSVKLYSSPTSHIPM